MNEHIQATKAEPLFNPLSPEFIRNPYPFYERLRALDPMHQTPLGPYVASRHAEASLVLRDGTALVLGPDSRLDLKQFHFDSTTQDGGLLVSLLRGSLRMVSGLIGKTNPDAVRVDTQTATIGIRGTDFIVTADAQP